MKDFTALLIIIDVDNIILGFADLKPDHIGFMAIMQKAEDENHQYTTKFKEDTKKAIL